MAGVRGSSLGLALLTLCVAAAVTTETLPVGLLPIIGRDLQIDQQVSGLLVSVYSLIVALIAIPLIRLTWRFPRKTLLIATIVGYAVSDLLVAVGPNFGWVVVGRVIGGASHALFFSVATAYATRLVAPERQGRAIAIVSSGASVGLIGGVPLSTALGTAFGWRLSFVVVGGAALVLALVVALLLPATSVTPASKAGPVQRGPARNLAVVAVANAVGFIAYFVLYTYIASVLLGAGIPVVGIAPSLLLLAVAGLLGLLIGGLFVDRALRVLFVFALLVAAGAAALTGAMLHSTVGVLIATSCFMLGFGGLPTSFAAASLRSRSVTADVASAVNNSASNVGITAGSLIGGAVVVGFGLGGLTVVSCGAFLLTVLLLVVVRTPMDAPTAAT